MNILELVDKEVIGLNGYIIGTIKSLVYDEKTWQIGFLDVQLDNDIAKEFDMKKFLRGTRININVAQVQGVGDKVTLKTGKEELMMEIRALEQST